MKWLAVVALLWMTGAYAASTIDSLNQQVLDLYNQGRFEEATPLCLQLVQALAQKYGEDSLQFASGLNNLAELYVKQKKPEQALPLYRKSLEIRVAQLGPDHPDVAKSRARLAEVTPPPLPPRQLQPPPQMAAPRPNPAQADMNKAMALNQQALALGSQGKPLDAIPLAKQVLTIFEADLPAGHPNIAIAIGNLAQLYARAEKYDEALPLFRRAAEMVEKRGASPEFGHMLANIGDIEAQKRDFTAAEPDYKRALSLLKPDDPVRKHILDNLAQIVAFKSQLSPDAPKPPDGEDIAQARELDQALFHLTEAKKYEDALHVGLDLQALTEKMYGPNSLAVALNLDRLAALYKAMGRDAEAEPLATRSALIRNAARVNDHSAVVK